MTSSIATGALLTPETWADFVTRLHHDCVGEGVNDHCTANAIFIVEAKRLDSGYDIDLIDDRLVYCDDTHWLSPQAYWDAADEDQRQDLDAESVKRIGIDATSFLALDADDQLEVLSHLDGHYVSGYVERWEYVNAHLTKDAAEAFIRRKKHDYPEGLRVYVDSQYYAWEFNTIKEAILSGKLVYKEGAAP